MGKYVSQKCVVSDVPVFNNRNGIVEDIAAIQRVPKAQNAQ